MNIRTTCFYKVQTMNDDLVPSDIKQNKALLFDQLIDSSFHGNIIDKDLVRRAGLDFLPRYVAEFILGNFISKTESIDDVITRAKAFVYNHFPDSSSGELLKHQLLEKGEVRILQKFDVNIDLNKALYYAKVPVLKEKLVVSSVLPSLYPALLTTGMWGLGLIKYDLQVPPSSMQLFEFKPFQLGAFDREEWFTARANFTFGEWVNLLIISLGLNPAILTDKQKIYIISRLIPLSKKNLNMAEFGPKGTGKTYQYRNNSSFVHIVSGSSITPAKFVYDLSANTPGLISTTDAIVFDEITSADFGNKKDYEMIGLLKDYMEGGSVSRGKQVIQEDTSIIFVGNIDIYENRPKYDDFVRELPKAFSETAFLDRINGIIPGWNIQKIVQINTAFTQSKGLIGNYLSEALHNMRSWDHPSLRWGDVDKDLGYIRNEKSVRAITQSLLTILFPGVEPTIEEINLCLAVACELRQIVYDQLSYLEPDEFPKMRLEAKMNAN